MATLILGWLIASVVLGIVLGHYIKEGAEDDD
jgi:hypothetical protein